MKLYAKTTSERASKGQGGNKYLHIFLTVGDADNQIDFGDILLDIRHDDDGDQCYMLQYKGQELASMKIQQKGEKQKGEKNAMT